MQQKNFFQYLKNKILRLKQWSFEVQNTRQNKFFGNTIPIKMQASGRKKNCKTTSTLWVGKKN